MKKLRVLVVDDSPIARGVLGEIVSAEPDMEVLAYAADGLAALKTLAAGQVDVVTLDIEMPRLDGLAVLSEIVKKFPTPVVMVAGSSPDQAQRTLQALSIGAIDFVEKHRSGIDGFELYRRRVTTALRNAASAKLTVTQTSPLSDPSAGSSTGNAFLSSLSPQAANSEQASLIVVGASTGGTEAIRILLQQLPATTPPIVVVVHMPAFFTNSYAQRLNTQVPHEVMEATPGQDLRKGCVYIAPGGRHLRVAAGRGGRFYCQIETANPNDIYKPSVDHLFESAAAQAQGKVMGFVLTGMGNDGAKGALAIQRAGGKVWGQAEHTCVVFGMPKAAFEIGALQGLLPIESLASELLKI
jgi:two-component system, chemotaxis family, protein-glutamate methylesterase/glutaminase